MDAFFSTLESIQKVQQSAKNEWKALSKEEKMRRDLDQRITKLEAVSDRNAQLAGLIEDNLDLVDSIINALRTELASGASWTELERMIAEEKQHSQNPLASSIKSLHFAANSVVVILGPDDTAVEINLGISAHANANNYYDAKKKAKNKSERTMAASEIAMKSAKVQAQKDLKKAINKGIVGAQALNVRRKVLWFEKFQWFITSDNFLVIGGRDAQQNELVVRRHLEASDLYFHADMHGASSVILKNPSSVNPVPDRSLQEAAQFTVCNSAAWTNKAIGSAYWVKADQVSKTAPTGMYVSTGSFMIRGKRNYIPCSQLLLGFTFLFRITDSCIEAHKNERSHNENDNESSCSDVSENANPRILENVSAMADVHNSHDNLGLHNLTVSPSPSATATISGDDHEVWQDCDVNSPEQSGDESTHALNITRRESGDHTNTSTGAFDAQAVSEANSAAVSFDVTGSLLRPLNDAGNDDLPSYNPNLFTKQESNQSSGGRITAKQRRQMKKSAANSIPDSSSSNNVPESKSKPIPASSVPRGKRNKLKKMKKKYADQDEEDRQRALQLLGASSMKEFPNDEAKSSDSSEEIVTEEISAEVTAEQEPVQSQDWIVKICFHCHSQGHVARMCPQLAGIDKTRINKIVQKGQERDREEDQKYARDDAEEQFDLRCLTGCPNEQDEILYALPMCAPYSAIGNYKFKVKVIPGVDKRGTAAKACLSLCMRMLNGDPDIQRIQNLLKSVNDNELANVLPPASKVSVPGIGSIRNTGKHGKKPGQKRPKK